MVYKSFSKYIVVTRMVKFNPFTLVFTFRWKYFYWQVSGLNLNTTLVTANNFKNLQSHACEPFRGLGPDVIAKGSPALEFFSSTFFPKPRTCFYVCLIDDAARIFSNLLCHYRESNSHQFSCISLRDLNSGRFTDSATMAVSKKLL